MLGLLTVRRGGLSAGALLDAVSASDDVMGAMGQEGTVMQYTGEGRGVVVWGGTAVQSPSLGCSTASINHCVASRMYVRMYWVHRVTPPPVSKDGDK